MSNGVIFYNIGTKMLVRLAVVLHSLRKHYIGKATILVDSESKDSVIEIANNFNVDVKDANFPQLEKNTAYLNSCLSHTVTPYDNSLWIDSDCLVLNKIDNVFEEIDTSDFVISQFSNWTTYKGRINKRIKAWENIYPEMIQPAIDFGPAINCGVFGFKKSSTLIKNWYDTAIKGKLTFIPDEVCCQLMLPHHNHKIISSDYNTSCKYSEINSNTLIIHYHGRKHCRIADNGKYTYNSDLWYKHFDEIKDKEFVQKWINSDRQLKVNLEKHNEKK